MFKPSADHFANLIATFASPSVHEYRAPKPSVPETMRNLKVNAAEMRHRAGAPDAPTKALFTPEECRIFFGWHVQRHLDAGVTALKCICPAGQEDIPAAWDLVGPA